MKNVQLCPICLAEHMTEEALVMVARVFQVERKIIMALAYILQSKHRMQIARSQNRSWNGAQSSFIQTKLSVTLYLHLSAVLVTSRFLVSFSTDSFGFWTRDRGERRQEDGVPV